MGVYNSSMFCCTLLYVHSSIAIILMGKRELIALLNLSSWCLVMVERLFLAVPQGCLQFVIVVYSLIILTYYFSIQLLVTLDLCCLVKRHVCDLKKSRLEHVLSTSVNDRVIPPFRECLNKSSQNI